LYTIDLAFWISTIEIRTRSGKRWIIDTRKASRYLVIDEPATITGMKIERYG